MADTLPNGTLIGGRYRVEDRLGKGSTGEVYLAPRTGDGRPFAVKVLSREYCSDPSVVRRLQRNSEVVCQLGHPNIVTTVDFGELLDGRLYLIMEYVPGSNLRRELRHLDGHPMTLRRALSLLKQICHGLTKAHDTGVIHRDIRPANVLLSRSRSGEELAKIVDFGLAKVMESKDHQGQVTVNRRIFGSPRYLAPEQLTGAPVDSRADVFSLGVTAYHLLTGEHPFPGKRMIEIVAAHQHAVPVLSLVRPADELKVPTELEDILMQCLRIDPEERPRHVGNVTESILMALNWVPHEPDKQRSAIAFMSKSQDQAGMWGHTQPPPVPPTGPAEVDEELVEVSAGQLSDEERQLRVWNFATRKAMDLVAHLEKHHLTPPGVTDLVVALSGLEEQEVGVQTEITVLKAQLDDAEAAYREGTAALRDALLNLRHAGRRLAENPTGNAPVLHALQAQVQALEAQQNEATASHEAQQEAIAAELQARSAELETVQRTLGEQYVTLVRALFAGRPVTMPREIRDGYAKIENLLRQIGS
jgi:serine/threonine protein kinase